MKNSGFQRLHFTLIELLTVIAVIAILAAILLPAVMKGLTHGEKSKALTQVKALVLAVKQYESTYGYLPCAPQSSDFAPTGASYTTLIGILFGSNTKGITFLDGGNGTNVFTDPWNNNFRIVLDADYNGQVTVPKALKYSVAVWSWGPDGTENNGTGDDVISW